jgi:hypothetical protein
MQALQKHVAPYQLHYQRRDANRSALQAPGGTEYLTVLEVCYERISVEPFREPAGSEASGKGFTSTTLIHLSEK